MPWVRFDDTFPTHRKVDGLSDAAFRLHVSAIFWCARNLTDGVVPEEDLDLVTARVRTPARFTAELVGRGLWHGSGHACPDCPDVASGWVIHGYLEFQPSKEKVLVDRRSSADRQKAWRDRHSQSNRNGSSNAVSNGPSNPAPTRPDPILGGALGDPLTPRAGDPPSPRCEKHQNADGSEPCGPCGDARRARTRFDIAEAERIRNAPKCRRHRGQLANNCALCRSERLAEETS
jgi:hypothetical protein